MIYRGIVDLTPDEVEQTERNMIAAHEGYYARPHGQQDVIGCDGRKYNAGYSREGRAFRWVSSAGNVLELQTWVPGHVIIRAVGTRHGIKWNYLPRIPNILETEYYVSWRIDASPFECGLAAKPE